jgi:hypothetical protein
MILARERFGHDTVRAQLDLPDFFENLAGNHDGNLTIHEASKNSLVVIGFSKLTETHVRD